MNVAELIKALEAVPQDASVGILYDGGVGLCVEVVWLARSGQVAVGAGDDVVYDTEDRPLSAPTAEECRYWKTPRALDEDQ